MPKHSDIISLSARRRHRSRKLWRPFLLLGLMTTGAWIVQIEIQNGTPEIARPAVLRGGDAWQGIGRNRESNRSAGGLSGPVTHVRDGDTIEVSGTAVRIANLDCAERGTSAGDRATRRMRELARQGAVQCQLSGRLSYDRQVGTCRLSSGQDVGAVLIAEGLCTRWR